MEKTQANNKIPLAAKVAPVVRKAVENVAAADDRSVSNVVERALKESPTIAEELERLQEDSFDKAA